VRGQKVPWRYRLETRQAIPIMIGLAGVIALLLTLGYLYAREQILASTRAQVAQLIGSIARQDDYNHNWLQRGMLPLVRLASQFPGLNAAQQTKADAALSAIISDARGRQTVDILLLKATGELTLRRYDSKGLLYVGPPEKGWTAEQVRNFSSPQWYTPTVDAKRDFVLRYSVPIRDAVDGGEGKSLGICSANLAISWFADRVRSFSPFKNCGVFFLTHDGSWTLPQKDDAPLAWLKQRMLARQSGEQNLNWNGVPYTAVYTPMASDELLLGLLIPRKDIFGDLDRLTHLLSGIGLIVLLLAAYSLHRTSRMVLKPLNSLEDLAERLARGDLAAAAATVPPQHQSRYPNEAQRLHRATETLRQALHQRVHDLTLIGQTRERIFGEMTFARAMQEAMRPKPLSPDARVEIAPFVHMAGEVCGDMYDYFFQSPRQLCCIMGNAVAHGVPAALLTGRVIPLLHELLLSGFGPGKALEYINRVLGASHSGELHMVSVFSGSLNVENGLFRWACAGQSPPFRCFGHDVEQLEWTGNIPLGINESECYHEYETRLRPGETLFFAGPRLLSVQDEQGTTYGEQALRAFLADNNRSPNALVRELFSALCTHAGGPPQEDLTFFALRWKGWAGEPLPSQQKVTSDLASPFPSALHAVPRG